MNHEQMSRRATLAKISFLFLFMLLAQNSHSQPHEWNYGYVGGISVNTMDNQPKAFLSPVIGGYTQRVMREYFFVSAGLEYTMMGNRYRDKKSFGDSSTEGLTSLIFHKINIPLTFGVSFKNEDLRVNLFIGYRHSYMLAGIYHSQFKVRSPDPSLNKEEEYRVNLFKLRNASDEPKRHHGQIHLGMSFNISKKFMIRISHTVGTYIFFVPHTPLTPAAWALPLDGFIHSDTSLCVIWLLRNVPPKKKPF